MLWFESSQEEEEEEESILFEYCWIFLKCSFINNSISISLYYIHVLRWSQMFIKIKVLLKNLYYFRVLAS